jgi:hypothetical protein
MPETNQLDGSRAQIVLFPPYEAEHRVFYVHVPGLLFMLNVGPDTDKTRRPLCLWNNPDRPILSSGVSQGPNDTNVRISLQHRGAKYWDSVGWKVLLENLSNFAPSQPA